jgi:hypothetical protein
VQLVHGASLSHFSFLRLHSRQLVISLFLLRIRGGAAGLEASCGVVLSRNTLKFGGDAFGDSLSPPVGDLSDGPGWYIQESDMVGIQLAECCWLYGRFACRADPSVVIGMFVHGSHDTEGRSCVSFSDTCMYDDRVEVYG